MSSLPEQDPTATGPEDLVEINPIAAYDSKGTRLTCVALADGEDVGSPVNGKRKRADEGVVSEDDEESDDADEEDEEEEEEESDNEDHDGEQEQEDSD